MVEAVARSRPSPVAQVEAGAQVEAVGKKKQRDQPNFWRNLGRREALRATAPRTPLHHPGLARRTAGRP